MRSKDPSPAFRLRRATTADVEAFAAQRVALFREVMALAPGPEAERLDAATRAAFCAGLERGNFLAWLALASPGSSATPEVDADEGIADEVITDEVITDEVIGSSVLSLVQRLPSPQSPGPIDGYVAHVFVVPAWRRAGIGSALVRAALDEVRARGLRRIRLHATEEGRALYERLGFRPRLNEMEWSTGPS